jgi:hypothetical protein
MIPFIQVRCHADCRYKKGEFCSLEEIEIDKDCGCLDQEEII